jgi:hypothetical protein
MKTMLKTLGVVALVAVLTVTGLSALGWVRPALAAEANATVAHGGGGRGFCGAAGLEAAAQALGMTADELQAELWGGARLSELADDAGVELVDVQAAVTAACVDAMRDNIEQAVTGGEITREHADWLLEGLDNGFWGPGAASPFGGFGGGRGFGGPDGHGPRFGGGGAPTTNPGGDA